MKKIFHIGVLTGSMLLAGNALAQAYVGVAVGPSHINADCSGTLSCDNSSVGTKLVGGYSLNKNLAIELTYIEFGKAKASVDVGVGVLNAEFKSTMLGGGVALMSDIAPSWNGVARVGFGSVKGDASGSFGGVTASNSESSTQAYLGLGIGYALNKELTLTGAMDFSKVKFDGENASLRLISLGVTYKF
jgi:OOP family OmpA-OmpF porin